MLSKLELQEISQKSRFFVKSGLMRRQMDATAFFDGREKTRRGQLGQNLRISADFSQDSG